jgi:hypothetical protein
VNQHFAEMLGHNPLGQKCYKTLYKLDHHCPWCCKEKVIRGETIRGTSVNSSKTRGEVLMMVTMQNFRPTSPAREIVIDADALRVDSLEKQVA